ncbi:MAG: CDP-alcohol phosphatidyltransferase family protein [Clostridia bacterium]|nr:CDP-alcohol phosphatidyltransferase family protein [Clostridia bacterium]
MNLPNKLSILRIIMVPLFVVAYFVPSDWTVFVALGIFLLAAITDFLDGYIARKYNLVTTLGKLLDPIADKILVCAALFCMAASNPLRNSIGGHPLMGIAFGENQLTSGHIFFAVSGALILSRELLIDAVRLIAASKGNVVQANIYGKIKTVLLDVSLPVLMAAEAFARVLDFMSQVSMYQPNMQLFQTIYNVLSWVGGVLFALAIVMTVLSGIVYIVQNRRVFQDK